MKKYYSIIRQKADAYTNRIIRLYKYLTEQKREYILSKQILRSGTSIGANVVESQNAQSPADWINKLNIALKEADETRFWLEKLCVGNYITKYQFDSMTEDNDEIIKILTSIIKTKKLKLGLY